MRPVHIHVIEDGVEAKFWLWPHPRLAYNDGFNARTLRELLEIIEPIATGLGRLGMSSSVTAISMRFDADKFWVELSDGRTLRVPLAWFPRLLGATPAQRDAVTISGRGLHWSEIDEDLRSKDYWLDAVTRPAPAPALKRPNSDHCSRLTR